MIIISAVVTIIIFAFQLYLGMHNYERHKLQLFQGIYKNIPSAAHFEPNVIALQSVHYSGFLVGYMAWGFIICFHLIFFVLIAIQIIFTKTRYAQIVLDITVPLLVIYILKLTILSSAGQFLYINKMYKKLHLKNRKVYALFIYFTFFAGKFDIINKKSKMFC
jgi:hypothetical protein